MLVLESILFVGILTSVLVKTNVCSFGHGKTATRV